MKRKGLQLRSAGPLFSESTPLVATRYATGEIPPCTIDNTPSYIRKYRKIPYYATEETPPKERTVSMKNTTLCYIFREEEVLLLHRIKKKNDLNEGMWIGIGGHFEENESPEECVLREVKEETGLTLTDYRYRGIVTFVSDRSEGEYMHLFTGTSAEGELIDCTEGELQWIKKQVFDTLPQWEGDKIFLRLLDEDAPFFSLKLEYEGNHLKRAILNGTVL